MISIININDNKKLKKENIEIEEHVKNVNFVKTVVNFVNVCVPEKAAVELLYLRTKPCKTYSFFLFSFRNLGKLRLVKAGPLRKKELF